MPRHIRFDSSQRTSGEIGNFKIVLDQTRERIERIYIDSIIIHRSWYTIMSGINDQITVTVAGPTSYVATLTEGNYSFATLATEIQTQLNSAYTPDNLFTVTTSTLTEKYTITHASTAHVLSFGTTTRSAAKTLGFAASDTSSATSHVADYIHNFAYTRKLIITSSALGSDYFYTPSRADPILFIMPVTGNFGDIMEWSNQGSNWFIDFDVRKTIRFIDIQIMFDDEVIVPFNGLDVEFVISYDTSPRSSLYK